MSDKKYAIAFFIYVIVLVVALVLALFNVITLAQEFGVILVAYGLLQIAKRHFLKNNNDEHNRN